MAGLPQEASGSRSGWRVRRGIAAFAGLLLLELVLVAAWVGYQGWAARGDLLDARAAARDGQAAIADFDIAEARSGFQAASDEFSSGYARLDGPVLRALSVLPVLGDDLAAARTLAWGGRQVADAALLVVATADDLGGLDAFAPRQGRLPVDAIAALAAPTDEAAAILTEVAATVEALPRSGLVPQVADARGEFADQLAEAQELVGLADEVTSVLPGFLGAEEPRRYLFAAQNPAELRGTGGFMGAYSILEIEEGELSFSEFIPVQELQSLHSSRVEAPNPDYAARYNRFGGAGFWQAINATPDFPSAATAIENLWEATEGSDVDGVVAVDPLAFEALLQLSGPVDVPGFGVVGADEVVEVVANEAYTVFEQDERKQILGAIAAGALQGALGGGDMGPLEAARAVLKVAQGGHLKIHASAPEEQRLLERFGVAGRLVDPPGDYLGVFVNSASFTKLDFYIDRHVAYDVTLHPDGSADGVARVTFSNSAPTEGLPRHIIGPGYHRELEAGENRSYVSIFCAVGCQPQPDDDLTVEQELGHGVVSRFLTVKSGESATVEGRWHLADAWDPASGRYTLTYQAQPTLRPTTVELAVTGPPGLRFENEGRWAGRVEGTQRIIVQAEDTRD